MGDPTRAYDGLPLARLLDVRPGRFGTERPRWSASSFIGLLAVRRLSTPDLKEPRTLQP